MKIVMTGGGTGGHFYPIIAVAEEIHKIVKEERLLKVELFFMSDTPYNSRMLFENGIIFKQIYAGKLRRYFSIKNILDLPKTALGILQALIDMYKLYPDVVFGKGGYASFPTLFAAKLLRIPVIIHESDSAPGKVNAWAASFAKRIAISYPEAAEYFPKEKVAYTGNPIRREVLIPATEGAYEFLSLEKGVPVILIVGGSQGAEIINDTLIDILPDLLNKYQVIHQTGRKNFKVVDDTTSLTLAEHPFKSRYRPFDYLNDVALKMAAGAARLIISRAGSSIFEIAAWGIPSIIIPIGEAVSHDQEKNAYNYSRTGACVVMEENNLTPHILLSEINRLFENEPEMERMKTAAKSFAKVDAAEKIAKEILTLALEHEPA